MEKSYYAANCYEIIGDLTKSVDWAKETFLHLKRPYRVHNVYTYPSWLERFHGQHPPQIAELQEDIKKGKINIELRPVDDIEHLLNSPRYRLGMLCLKGIEPCDRYLKKAVRRARAFLGWLDRLMQWLIGRLSRKIARFRFLRSPKPVSGVFGFNRGTPIDRYYIEGFLLSHASDIHGRVLEIGDNAYTIKFGDARVAKSDILNVWNGNPKTTIFADLANNNDIPADTFDCVIFTQTLQNIYDCQTALKTLYRILKPGGILLATFPGISQISRYDMERWGDFWRFTTLSARRLFGEIFGESNIAVKSYGNVLTASAFLYGMAAGELKEKELNYRDPNYETLITVRAVKCQK